MALNQTQPLTQTQLIGETQPCSDNDSDYKSPKKSDVWGKLFPISEYFVPIGNKIQFHFLFHFFSYFKTKLNVFVELTKDVTTFGRRDDCNLYSLIDFKIMI
jgi:hypothetical protein